MSDIIAPAHANRRPHIQGIRAVAVLLVIAGHGFGWPAGGFLGVDMFFVVSGFVITLSLLREAERDGTVSLRAFVIRRVGRLFPAAALVIAVTVAIGAVVFFLPRAMQLALDGVASLLWVANWRTARLGTDYFAGFAQSSPLQHYWSLAVEEQFYALWPFAFALCALTGWPRVRRVAGWVAGAATAISFGIAMIESALRPAWAYFSFESRAWELGVGVTLAIVLVRTRLRPTLSAVLALSGAVAVIVAVLLVDGSTGFPAPWALPVVLGTAALIAAGETATPARMLAPLRLRPLTFLGDISYSLYLWHYPLLIFAAALLPGAGVWLSLVLLLPVAVATYRFVEVPFRNRAGRVAERGAPGTHFAWGAAAIAVVAGLSAAQILAPSSWIQAPEPATSTQTRAPFASQTQLERAIAAAIETPEAPTEAIEGAWPSSSAAQYAATRGCLRGAAEIRGADSIVSAGCTFAAEPDAPTLVVFGDSVAASWLPGIVAAAQGEWRVIGLGIQSCPPYAVSVTDRTGNADFTADCDAARERALSLIEDLDPELVVLGGALGSYDRLSHAEGATAASDLWHAGVVDTVTALTERTNARVAILASPPETTPVLACATRLTGTAACLGSPSSSWHEKTDAETSAAASVSVAAIDTTPWLCRDDLCPAVVDGTLVLADGGHLTTGYAQRLSGILADALGLSRAPSSE